MEKFNKTLVQALPDSGLVGILISYRLFKRVQDNRCVELAIEERLLWGPRSVVMSSLKGEVAETGID